MIFKFFRDFSSDVRSNMFKDNDGNWTCQFCGYNSKGRFHLIRLHKWDWIEFNKIFYLLCVLRKKGGG